MRENEKELYDVSNKKLQGCWALKIGLLSWELVQD